MDVVSKLNDHGVPCGPIYNAADIVEDPQFRARDAIVHVMIPEAGRPLAMQGIMPKFSATPGAIRWTGPPLGSSNDEIYKGLLGLDARELDGLRHEGVI